MGKLMRQTYRPKLSGARHNRHDRSQSVFPSAASAALLVVPEVACEKTCLWEYDALSLPDHSNPPLCPSTNTPLHHRKSDFAILISIKHLVVSQYSSPEINHGVEILGQNFQEGLQLVIHGRSQRCVA